MRTLFRSLVLAGIIAAVVASAGAPPAPAQQKEKDKKDDKKEKEEVGTIEVYKAKDGWRYRIKNADDKSVAISTVGYDKKEEALKALDFLKVTLTKAKVTEIKEEKK